MRNPPRSHIVDACGPSQSVVVAAIPAAAVDVVIEHGPSPAYGQPSRSAMLLVNGEVIATFTDRLWCAALVALRDDAISVPDLRGRIRALDDEMVPLREYLANIYGLHHRGIGEQTVDRLKDERAGRQKAEARVRELEKEKHELDGKLATAEANAAALRTELAKAKKGRRR